MQIATECKENSLVSKSFAKGRGNYGNLWKMYLLSVIITRIQSEHKGVEGPKSALAWNIIILIWCFKNLKLFRLLWSSPQSMTCPTKENNLNKGSLKVTIN